MLLENMTSDILFPSSTLKEMRQEAGINQTDFAKFLDKSEYTVRRIENKQQGAHAALSASVLRKWYSICRPTLSNSAIKRYNKILVQYFELNSIIPEVTAAKDIQPPSFATTKNLRMKIGELNGAYVLYLDNRRIGTLVQQDGHTAFNAEVNLEPWQMLIIADEITFLREEHLPHSCPTQ